MSKLDELLEDLYLQGYRDSTRRASGRTAAAQATKGKLKRLFYELVGNGSVGIDYDLKKLSASEMSSMAGRNELTMELRQKVKAL